MRETAPGAMGVYLSMLGPYVCVRLSIMQTVLRKGQTVTQKEDGEADCSNQHCHHCPIAVLPVWLKNIFTALTQTIIINYSMMNG